MTPEHFDIIIVGSGLSGIDAAYHLQTSCRRKSYIILESRDAIGGTWIPYCGAGRLPLTRRPVSY